MLLSDNSGDATTNIPFLYYIDVVGRQQLNSVGQTNKWNVSVYSIAI